MVVDPHEYYVRHRDHILARVKARAQVKRDEIHAYKSAWRAINRDEINAKKRADYQARKDAINQRQRDKYARDSQLKASDGRCGICRQPLDLFGTHFDHIIPLARGGRHERANIQPVHAHCNLAKGTRLPGEIPLWL